MEEVRRMAEVQATAQSLEGPVLRPDLCLGIGDTVLNPTGD